MNSLLTNAGEPTKRCFKCERQLPRDQFYKHPMMGDGLLGKCKSCTKRDVRENREARHSYYIAVDRERSKTPERRKAIQASKKRHPQKEASRKITQQAIARGELVKQPCEVCGSLRVDAHHDDYDKPLEIRWLCRKHHMELHRHPTF
jgi:hypothetical protein